MSERALAPVRTAPDQSASSSFATLFRSVPWGELSVPIAVLAIILAMVTPLPPFLLDILISTNITLSTVILLVSIYIVKPVDFSVFPTVLLLMTLFRLALNVSTSRLILLQGNSGTTAAGDVIDAFGNFVVGGNYIIGTVMFLVLIVIQYVVINHGAVRISEVTARFTLDAMPGKQMSIDADLNAGLIDEPEARKRRAALSGEAEFYGAMDGASRFTQRDAVASILITAINIIAGLLIGILQHGMDIQKALQTYTILTIGDGLVTVMPALMISISGGLIVTRASSEVKLAGEFVRQVFGNTQPLFLAAGILLTISALPGMPKIPFLLLGGACAGVAWKMHTAKQTTQVATPAAAPVRDSPEALLRVEPLAVEVGLGLVRFVEGGSASTLLKRIGHLRRQLATQLGYVLPPVRVTDNLSLKAREYVVLLKGSEIARYELPQGYELAVQPNKSAPALEGVTAKEPAFGMPAYWILPQMVERAKSSGYTVADPVSVLATHLGELIRQHAHELFTRQDCKRLLDRVSEEQPKAVEDLVPKLLTLAVVQKVLQNLLRERVSVRDAASIVEALGEAAQVTKNSVLLTEYVRQSIRRAVVMPYLNESGDLPAFFLEPAIEQLVESAVEHSEHVSHLALAPQKIRELIDKISRAMGQCDGSAVLLTGSGSRFFVRQMLESSLPRATVLSHSEIPPGIKVLSLGTVQ